MRTRFYLLFLFVFLFSACKNQEEKAAEATLETNRDKEIQTNLQRLKATAQDGDLLVRLNDDFVSEQLRFFNEKDKSFSHSGIIITKNGVKTVCSILPSNSATNPVVYAPIDSFLNPATNTSCGLFRYELSSNEKTAFIDSVNSFATKKIYFDSTINLKTDDSLYCSEMIYKTLKQVTNNRIDFKTNTVPKKMQPTLYLFYRGRLSRKDIAERQVIFIDNLYRIPQCKELMRFRLKYFPGT